MPSHALSPTRRRVLAGFTAAALVIGLGVAGSASAATDPVRITLLTINDFHGRIEKQTPYGPGGGVAALATAIRFERVDNPNTIVASAGDNIGGSPFTSFALDDAPTIETLNAAGLDVSAVGDGEFSRGVGDLTDRVVPAAAFPYLAANVYDTATDEPLFEQFSVEEVGGVRVGFVGAVTTALPQLVPQPLLDGIEVRDIPTEVNRVADELSDGDAANGEADIVVALVHEGAATAAAAEVENPATPLGHVVAELDDDVDLIVSGHTGRVYQHAVGGREVSQAGSRGEYFTSTSISYDPDARAILAVDSHAEPMWERFSTGSSPRFADDPTVASLVAHAVTDAAAAGREQIGLVSADMNRARRPATGGGTTVFPGGESTLGNFVADAQLWAARRTMPDTAMALTHPATLGADLTRAPSGGEGVGAVTLAEAAAVHPAAAPLAVVTMLGDDVRAALEQQFQPEGSQPFVKLGVSKGLTYTTWYDAPAGTRIRDLRLNGVYVHPLQTYRVAVDAMSLTPSAGFAAIADAENRTPTGATDLSALVDWFGGFGTAAPDVVQRSIGITLPGTDQTFTTGERIAVELSALDFTTSEPGAGTAVVSIGGITAGTAAVDRTLVADDDRTGRATVAAVVPSGLRGELPLTVTTSTGTRISTPVTIERGGKQPSLTIAQPRKLVWKYPEPVWMVIRVISDGDTTGEVTLYVDGEYAGSSSIGSNGYSTVGIGYGSMKRGFHTLSATFSGNAETAPSGGPPLPILVR